MVRMAGQGLSVREIAVQLLGRDDDAALRQITRDKAVRGVRTNPNPGIGTTRSRG